MKRLQKLAILCVGVALATIFQSYTATGSTKYLRGIFNLDNFTHGSQLVHQDSLDNTHKLLNITPNFRDRNCAEIESQLNTSVSAPTCIAQVLSPWSTAAPSPINRSEANNAVVNGKLYVFGGYVNSSFQATTRSDVYDPATDTWMQIADLPLPITHAGVAVDGDTIYLAGGYIGDPPAVSTAKVFKYSVTTNTWSEGRSLPEVRGAGGLVILGRDLHFFSGHNFNRTQDKGSHWVINLDSGAGWTSKAPLPNPRNHFGYIANNGQIYVIGGQHLKDDTFANQSDVHVYNKSTNTWRKLASLPIARSHTHTSTFVRDGKIVIVGGRANGSTRPVLADVTEYEPTLNKWVALSPLPELRQAAAAQVINNQIVVTTGSASGPSPQTTTWLSNG